MPGGFWHAASKDEDGELIGAFVRCPQCNTPKFIPAIEISHADQTVFECCMKDCIYRTERPTVLMQHWTDTRAEMEWKKPTGD